MEKPVLSRPEAIIFDLDDCLLRDDIATAAGVDALFASLEQLAHDDPERQFKWGQAMAAHIKPFLQGESSSAEFIRRRMATLLDDDELELATAEIYFHSFYQPYLAHTQLFDDALPALEQLTAQQVQLALITNGADRMQRDKLAAAGLNRFFANQSVFTAEQLGVGKPDPEIFTAALDALGLKPESTWYIGDNLRNDARGANHAGMTGIWLNRGQHVATWHLGDGYPTDSQAPDVIQLSSLAQLVELLNTTI